MTDVISPLHGAVAERFWAKVEKTDYCWLWTARKHTGYGSFYLSGRMTAAHRLVWESVNGRIPDRHEIDHICMVRACVNPDHLRSATRKQNQENRDVTTRNKSGVRGVYWVENRQSWRASVTHNYKSVHAGIFKTLEEAEAAVTAKRNELFTYNALDRGEARPHD